MGVGWTFDQGYPWFRICLTLGLVHSLDFGDISESEFDFESRGSWGYFDTAGGNRFGGRVFWG